MLAPAESIYGGTWASGPIPEELFHFELMRYMGWSWDDLERTPMYVRRYCWDLMTIRLDAERAAAQRASEGRHG